MREACSGGSPLNSEDRESSEAAADQVKLVPVLVSDEIGEEEAKEPRNIPFAMV